MKTSFFIFLFIISSMGFAQNNYIVKTDDGRRVLLKADFTWEYIDLEQSNTENVVVETPTAVESDDCKLPEGFEEPKLDSQVQNKLRKGHSTIEYIKKKVAKDYDCLIDDVILISVKEKINDGFYDFCVKGKKASYKRVGNNIMERNKLFKSKSK